MGWLPRYQTGLSDSLLDSLLSYQHKKGLLIITFMLFSTQLRVMLLH